MQHSTSFRKDKIRPSFILLLFLCLGLYPVAQAQVRIESAKILGDRLASDDVYIYFTKTIQGKTYQVGYIDYDVNLAVTDGSTHKGNADIIIGVIDENGNTLLLSQYGGSRDDQPTGFDVVNGKIRVSFYTASIDLPVTNGTTNPTGEYYTGLLIMDEATGAIDFATYIGGSNGSTSYWNDFNILRSIGDDIVVTGDTESTDFPTTNGTVHQGDYDIFVRRYTSGGTLVFSTLIGSEGYDDIYDIEYQNGIIYVVAQTKAGYPVTDGSSYTPLFNNDYVSALTALDANTGAILWSKYITNDFIYTQLIADASGVFLVGFTNQANFSPITMGSSHAGGNDNVVMKFNPAGTLLFSRFIGGSGNESTLDLELSNGELYLLGRSNSPNYPVVNGLPPAGGFDIFLTKVGATGQIVYSTLIGGTGNDWSPVLGVVNGEAYLGFNCSVNTPSTDGSSYNSTFPYSFAITKFDTNGKLCFSSIQKDGYSNPYYNQEDYKKWYIEGNYIYYSGNFGNNNVSEAPLPSTNYVPGVVKYKICPSPPTISSDPILPATQTVCANGLVQQLIGDEMVIPGSEFPLLYTYYGSPFEQKDLPLDYQWQIADSPTGPWTDLAGATDKNYSPFPTTTSKYFRRLTLGGECCGGALISTSEVAAVVVGANSAPIVDAGGGVTSIMQTCSGVGQNLGGSPTATGGVGPYSYLWSNGSTSANPLVSTTVNEIYTLTVTDANGCQQADQVILNAYTADAGLDKGNCAGAGVMIGTEKPAGATGITYQWTRISGSGIGTLSCTTCATPIASPTATTVYQVQMTVTKSNGGTCSTTDQVTVTPVTAPTANFAGADRVVCFGSTTSLGSAAQAGYTYLWSPGTYIATSGSTATFDAGSTKMPTPNEITYVVTATKDGCVFADEVKVAVIEARAGEDYCGPRTLGLADRTPNINETYSWTKVGGSGTGNFIGPTNQLQANVSASVGGDVTYRLTTTYTLNGVTGTCTDDVVVPATCGGLSCDIEVIGDASCPANGISTNPVTLTAIPSGNVNDYTYSWSPAAGLSSTTSRTVTLTDNVHRTYTVTMTSILDPSYSCTASEEANNPVWSIPTFNGPSPITACSGASVSIGDPANNPGYTYSWSGVGLSDATISLPDVIAPDDQTYVVTVADKVTGCTLKDTVQVFRSTAANAGADQSVCVNGTVKIGSPAESGYTYSWSPAGADWRNGTDQNSAQPEVFVAITTTFTLTKTHTASGCVTTDEVVVTSGSPLPPFTLSPFSYCPGNNTVTLGYSDGTTSGTNQVPTGTGYTYVWDNGSLLNYFAGRNPRLNNPKPTTPTTFTVTVTSPSGCNQTASQTITPTASSVNAGSDKQICLGSTVSLGSAANPTGGGIVYSWAPTTGLSDPSSPNPVLTPSAVGTTTYTLTKTSGGCSVTGQVIVSVQSVSTSAIAPQTVCSNTAVVIGPTTPSAEYSYAWSPSIGLNNVTIANPTASLSSSQTYTLRVTNNLGCQEVKTVVVGVNSSPSPTVTVPDVQACLGASGVSFNPTVSPAGSYNYVWTPSQKLSSATVANPTLYTTVASETTYSLKVTNPTTGCFNTANNIKATVAICEQIMLVSVSGNVLNDPNATNVNNSSGDANLVPTGLTAILVDQVGKVVANATVGTNGQYDFGNVSPGDYTVVLSTTAGTIGSTPPATSLPMGWLNTGEFTGTPDSGNDGSVNGGSDVFTVTTTDVTNVNFGIQQPPTANVVVIPTVPNPGGTIATDFTSSFGGDDPTTNGIVASLKITEFPTNATSISIDGVLYTDLTSIETAYPNGIPTDAMGVPTVPILVDPMDGAQTVVVPYVTIDNAGVESTTPGSVTAGFTVVVSVSGNVFNDPDATNVNNSSGDANVVPDGITAVLVDNTTGLVTANTAVGTDGVFDFGNVAPGDYTVVLSTTAGTIGSTPPATSLPMGWLNTGEFTGIPDSGNDGSVNGSSDVFTVTTTDVTNVNFGIQQPPTANVVVLPTVPNPGGTIATDFTSSFGGDDPTTNGIVASLKITGFPANATSISIDGVVYTDLTSIQTAYPTGIPTDAMGVPTVPILVDPMDGAQTVVVPYVTIDNAGVESTTPGSVTAGFTVVVSVSGNVFNDPDATNVNNSSGDANVVPDGITAVLVDNTTGLVTANTAVGTDGVFDFGNVSPGDYTVVLSTTAGTIGSTPPATSLPMGWLNTGEFTGTPDSGNDGSVNGGSEVFTVTTTDVTNVNFGIQQPPTANVVVIPTVPNPGGTIATDFTSSFGGDDPTTNGIVASLKITDFPANATSISIDGVVYTDLTSIETAYPNGIPTDAMGVPTVPILVDPMDGAQTVVVPYVTIDNAGVESTSPGSVTAGFTVVVSVSGNVFNDPDATNVNNSSGDANLVPDGMTAVLVDNTTGLVTANTAVGTDGVFDFGNVSPGDYTVVLSTTAGTIGSTPPATSLPMGWLNTGEFTGIPDSGNDGSVNGSSDVFTVTTTDVTNVNFGIQQPPTANVVVLPTVPNPGGTIATDFTSSFGGDDPTTNGIVASLKITDFPANATSISIDGVVYTDLTSIQTAYPNGIPTDDSGVPTVPILVDPMDGAQTVVVPYVTIDNAGVESPTPGSVTAGFTVVVSVSGNVFNDPDATNVNNSSGDANLVPDGMTAILVDNTTGLVTANTAVGTDGVFDFGNVSPGDYTVVLSTTAGTIGSTPPATSLPMGWLNTGEFTGTPDSGNDGSVNGNSDVFTVTTTDVTNVNFGIQQPPTANVVVIPTVPNPGGTIATDFTSSFGGDDPTTNGIVASLKITDFPANATSISIDGVVYTDLTSIQTAYPTGIPTNAMGVPTVPILVDPMDGAQTVVVPYVTIDNAGVESPTPGSVTAGFTVVVSVSGNVFNDPDATNVNNSSGDANLVPDGMTAILVENTTGLVTANTAVGTDGVFDFGNVSPGDYTVVLSTTAGTIGSTPPATSLPMGWLNTGEFTGTPDSGNDGSVNGNSDVFTVTTTDVTNVNFGIQQPPTANVVVIPTVPNPGGTIATDFTSSFGGDDPTTNGIVASLKITDFPANATSISIDGVVYTDLTSIQTAYPTGIPTNAMGVPTVPILVDPMDGAQTVVVPYVTIDNAGVESPTPGSVTAGFTVVVSVSGNVFNDPDATNVNNSSGDANLVPDGMTAILVDNTTGLVTANTAVGTDGVFDFGNVSPGDYTVVLSTTAGTIGSTPPATSLPMGWLNTGEFTGTPDSGNDGSVNGNSDVFTVTTTDVTNVNFGIQQPPTANVVVIPTVPNPGGTIATDFTSSFGGDDPTTNGIVASLKITDFPANATSISIDGVVYTDLTSIQTAYPNGIPTDDSGVPTVPILVDPMDGAQTVVVPYVTIDNAGVESPTPGSVTAGFTVVVSVSGNVFNDPDATNVNNSSGDANLVPDGMTAILVDNTTGLVTANTAVGTDGVFDFGNVSPGDYTVVLSTTAGTIGSTPPATSLPMGWLNTGEFTGTPDSGNDGSVNGGSDVFTVTTTDVTNVNFGIQQPPTANVVVIPTVPNPGGTIATDFTSSFGGDDPTTNGIVASLKITDFPANATSISIDGVVYTDLTSIQTAYPNGIPTDDSGVPTVPILVDPMDGAQTVVVPYVTIDNAGVESPTPGSVTAGFTVVVSVSGNVFNDPDATNVNNSSGDANLVPDGMTAILVDNTTGLVTANTAVGTDGVFDFGNVSPGDYTVVLSTTAGTIGSTPPATSLPMGWLNTGEFTGTPDSGNDGSVNGGSDVFTVTTTDVTNVNFGIQQPPTANVVVLDEIVNPEGTISIDITSEFGGDDPSKNGVVTALKITGFPSNATSISIDGVLYTDLTSIETAYPNGIPTDALGVPTVAVLLDPIDGDQTIVVPYINIDNAGIESMVPGSVTLPLNSGLPVTLIDFNAEYRESKVAIDWKVAVEKDFGYYEVQRASDAKTFIGIATIEGSNRTNYSYEDVSPLVGTSYYRLKMVDLDGSYAYSHIRSVARTGATVMLYPNPVVHTLKVQDDAWSTVNSITVYNISGISVMTKSGRQLSNELDVRNLQDGAYTLKLGRTNGTTSFYKFLIIK